MWKKAIASILLFGLMNYTAAAQEFLTVEHTAHYRWTNQVEQLQIKQVLPPDIPGRQTVLDMQFSIPPKNIYEKDGMSYAFFDFWAPEGPEFLITTKYSLLLYPYDFETAQENRTGTGREEALDAYLGEEVFIKPNHKEIVAVANTITGETEAEIVRNIFDFVTNHLEYKNFSTEERGAVKALKQGKGDCTEYAELMVALCRAKGIPARMVSGAVFYQNLSGNVMHNWLEVYFKDIGWVPFDPTFADCELERCPVTFDQMTAAYLYFSYDRSGGESGYKYAAGKTAGMQVSHDFRRENHSEKAVRDATFLLGTGEPDRALASVDTFLANGPENFALNLVKSKIFCAKEDPDAALPSLQKAGSMAKRKQEKAEYLYASALWHAARRDTASVLHQLEKWMNVAQDISGKSRRVLEERAFHDLWQNPRFANLLKTAPTDYWQAYIYASGLNEISLQDYQSAWPAPGFPYWQLQDFTAPGEYYKNSIAAGADIKEVQVTGAQPDLRYIFDKSGKLLTEYAMAERIETTYDESGRRSIERVYDRYGQHSKELPLYSRVYRYSPDGNLREIGVCLGGCEVENARPFLRFESAGEHLAKVFRFNREGQPFAESVLEFSQNRLSKITTFMAWDTITLDWQFDAAANKFIQQLTNSDTSFAWKEYFFDTQGRIEQVSYLFPGNSKIMYTYDAQGRIDVYYRLHHLKEEILTADTYIYDKTGLLEKIKRTSGPYIRLENGEPRFKIQTWEKVEYSYELYEK